MKAKIYGISYPYAHFFIFDINTKTTEDLGEFLEERVFDGPERIWLNVPRALYEKYSDFGIKYFKPPS